MGNVYLARVLVNDRPRRCQWWAWDAAELLKGRDNESRAVVLGRWGRLFGEATKAIRYGGVMRLSEAAMTVAASRRPAP